MVACLVVAVPACGSDDDESSTTPTTSLCDVVRLSDDDCDLTKLLDIKDVGEKGAELADEALDRLDAHAPEPKTWRPRFTAWQDNVVQLRRDGAEALAFERAAAASVEELRVALAAEDANHIAQARAALCALPIIPC